MNTAQKTIRVLILASHYRPDHVARIKPYHSMNKAASSWNTALFNELRKLPVELHIVQFYPVLKTHIIREDNVTYYYLPRIPKIDGFTSLAKKWRIHRLARKIKPDVIHGIGSEHGHAWAAIHKEWPSVITIHGYLKNINRLAGHQSLLKTWFLEREEHKALLKSNRVIAINGYMKDLFMQAGCQEKKLAIVPNALNPIFLKACDETEREIDILMVGTLHPLKNQRLALKIFAQLKSAHGRLPKVVIAGAPTAISQDYYNDLRKDWETFELCNVQLIGSVDQEKLKTLYCTSKILLHISEFEADPTVVSEALACGCLPVVNPVAGLAYRVKHGINGYHLHIKDIDLAAKELTNIMDDYAKTARTLLDTGKASIIGERSPQNVAQQTYNVYLHCSGWLHNHPNHLKS